MSDLSGKKYWMRIAKAILDVTLLLEEIWISRDSVSDQDEEEEEDEDAARAVEWGEERSEEKRSKCFIQPTSMFRSETESGKRLGNHSISRSYLSGLPPVMLPYALPPLLPKKKRTWRTKFLMKVITDDSGWAYETFTICTSTLFYFSNSIIFWFFMFYKLTSFTDLKH